MIINTINTSGCQPQTIVIGRRGTYDTMQIAFDLSYLVESYGNGVAVLAVKRSQDSSAYPAVTSQADNILTWIVSDVDTYYVGAGECQLMWYVDGGLAKTIIYPMVVMRDILATSEEAPDAYQEWVDALIAEGAETLQNAQNAEQSASDAEGAKDDAVTAKEAAEAAQEAAETAVTHYPVIQNNYWMVWNSATQQYVSTGIQAEGEDGYSPEVTITSIEGGHRVTITDKDHPQGQSFDVMDGQGGGGTSDYTDLTNKPSINNVTLTGNKTAADLGLATPSDIPTDAGDIEFDDQETYAAGSVGAELSAQSNAISANEESITDTQSMVATVETTTTASKNYAVGDLLVYDGKLYKVTSAIATGATITVGTNVTQTTVESQIASARGDGYSGWLTAEISESNYDATVGGLIFDAGNGNKIAEAQFYGQIIYDDGLSSATDVYFGFGNTVDRIQYSSPASATITDTTAKRISMSGYARIMEGILIRAGTIGRSIMGDMLVGKSDNANHELNIDFISDIQASTRRATNPYPNFNDTRYMKFVTSVNSAPSWAYFRIMYKLQ